MKTGFEKKRGAREKAKGAKMFFVFSPKSGRVASGQQRKYPSLIPRAPAFLFHQTLLPPSFSSCLPPHSFVAGSHSALSSHILMGIFPITFLLQEISATPHCVSRRSAPFLARHRRVPGCAERASVYARMCVSGGKRTAVMLVSV